MKIDAFITCIGDNSRRFLELTLRYNKQFFDSTNIITDTKDIKIREFCESARVNCIVTDLFYKNNAKFNRGAALNYAFELVKPIDWVCHLDADCIVKNEFMFYKKEDDLYVNAFYGCRRVIVPKLSDLKELIEGKVSDSKFTCFNGIAYGFFQLWNVNSDVIKSGVVYPESFDSSESDWKMRNFFGETLENDTRYTGTLKELGITCWHLGNPGIDNSSSFWD